MLRERPKSIKKEDSKRVSSVGFKKLPDEDHTHKRSTTAEKPAKKKMSKKKRLEEEKKRLDEEERRLAEIQAQRRQQLEQLRIEEFKKLTKEENERLQKEFPEYYDKCQKFESLAFIAARREKELRQWDMYISDSEMIDVDKEKEIHKIIASLNENMEVTFNYEPFEKWMSLLTRIIDELSSKLKDAKASRDHQKSFYYQEHLTGIENALRRKIQQYIQYNIDNFEKLLEIKNKELKEKNLPMLSLDTEKHINQIVFKKSEQRYKYEITRVITNTELAKLTMWFNLIKVGYRPKPLVFPSLRVQMQIPRAFIQNSTVVCCLKSKTNRYSSLPSPFHCVGDVIQFFIYPFFPLPRVNARFTLKKITDIEPENQDSKRPKTVQRKISYEGRENERLTLRLGIPTGFYYTGEELTVGMFQEGTGWTNKGVTGVTVDEKDGMVKFQVGRLLPMSILLPKNTDCPYKSFFLRCTSTEVATLDLETRRGIKLQFEIGKTFVKLVNNAGIIQLDPVVGEQFSSGKIVKELSSKGIMINLSDEDTSFIPKCKIPQAQNKIIEDLAFVVSGFAFKNSQFNSQSSQTEIVVQAKSHLDFELRDIPDDLHPWQTYLFTINKCGLLSSKLKSFKEEYDKNTVTHINMEKLVRENTKMATEEVLDRFTWVSLYPDFLLSLKTFIKQIKLFSLTY